MKKMVIIMGITAIILSSCLLSRKAEMPEDNTARGNGGPGITQEKDITKTYCTRAARIDADRFPEFRHMPFGLEEPRNIPEAPDNILVLDRMYDSLYILNGLLPENSVTIRAEDPSGGSHEWYYSFGEGTAELITHHSFSPSLVYDPPVLSLKFRQHAMLPKGRWTMDFYYDGKSEKSFTGRVDINPLPVSITTDADFSPLAGPPWEITDVSPGETVQVAFSLPGTGSFTYLLYRSDESGSGSPEMVYSPEAAFTADTDEDGKYRDTLIIGKDLPKGTYHFAFGETIEGIYFFRSRLQVVDR